MAPPQHHHNPAQGQPTTTTKPKPTPVLLPYRPHFPQGSTPPPKQGQQQQQQQEPSSSSSSRRPPPRDWKPVEPLQARYKPAARRWTMAIVAMPIAIVTSWALYDRLVLGKERKEMPRVVNSDLSNAVKEVDTEEKKR
ncbi:uncharacterized protein BKCO1_900074 [Diplodia corticola]|uniref:Uncharacterized protein n=1 Tax=Diplodia corticola TaxID=236234 RepID=A0A1J9R9B9_9PEZI|nr:uncharacterized protein BKCO1_900074 [Diplodia corticola]OJD36778.1 hypothetical protein BKCO1_900074 [Diplodia corticola]